MNYLTQYKGKKVHVELSSKKTIIGILVDFGTDIIVINDGIHYYYIPLLHVQFIKQSKGEIEVNQSNDAPIVNEDEKINFRKILNNAKGLFAEIFVSGNQSIYGYITSIMNNYFVFYSPVFKTMLIPLNHVKWIIPYHLNQRPYSLSSYHFPVKPSTMTLARTFEEQIKKFQGKLVVFDLGENPNKIGMLNKLEGNIVELINGREEKIHWNLAHLKTVHTVYN